MNYINGLRGIPRLIVGTLVVVIVFGLFLWSTGLLDVVLGVEWMNRESTCSMSDGSCYP